MEIPHVSLSRYYLVTFIWISRISFLTSLQFSTSIQPLSISSAFSSFDAWAGELIYLGSLLLLLLSHFSRVQLCATPWMAAHQAPPSLGFSRQEHWVGCHFLLQCMKVKSESEVPQSCPTLSDPMDCSLPGSSVHGIFQARVLEWDAIAFSAWAP